MTSNLEELFFLIFEIEPIEHCKHECDPYRKCLGCIHADELVYPSITDHILLQLICIRSEELISIIKVKGRTIEELKDCILRVCIEDYLFNSTTILASYRTLAANFKSQVQKLFAGGLS